MSRVPVQKTYKLYIGGAFPRTESGRYRKVESNAGQFAANVCMASRKDLREAVVQARKAWPGWSARTAYNRGQILYRIAEMLEGRRSQFVEELMIGGADESEAAEETNATIDRLIYYAGWADKYQQVLSRVNPVSTSHFNFSVAVPVGVVGIVAPATPSLLGLVSLVAPALAGGNTVVAVPSLDSPFAACTFAEVLHASDVPGGVVNILTGDEAELVPPMASHMDINSIVDGVGTEARRGEIQSQAIENLKRVVVIPEGDWFGAGAAGPYHIQETQEIQTTWHPVGV